ncbi:uncharacterized protein METZ01_LOCUS258050, partial [marine metagenome]
VPVTLPAGCLEHAVDHSAFQHVMCGELAITAVERQIRTTSSDCGEYDALSQGQPEQHAPKPWEQNRVPTSPELSEVV